MAGAYTPNRILARRRFGGMTLTLALFADGYACEVMGERIEHAINGHGSPLIEGLCDPCPNTQVFGHSPIGQTSCGYPQLRMSVLTRTKSEACAYPFN